MCYENGFAKIVSPRLDKSGRSVIQMPEQNLVIWLPKNCQKQSGAYKATVARALKTLDKNSLKLLDRLGCVIMNYRVA